MRISLPAVLAAACVVLGASPAGAIGPHEVLVLANEQSADSVLIASEYMRGRGIPPANLVLVRPVAGDGPVPADMSQSAFTSRIWEPARRAVAERGLGEQILAWVYSVDFPVRISSQPAVSITGLTFVRNRMPDGEAVAAGTYESLLFAGPSSAGAAAHFPQSLDAYREWLGEKMPLPSMMLGVTGPRGNTLDQIRACLKAGLESDGVRPEGAVYFVTGGDIRAACRSWEFPGAAAELRGLGVEAVVTNAFPAGRRSILGIVMGAEHVRPGQGETYGPGSMAEHLTSFAGVFDTPHQTKLSAWIAAGATASAGTVTEPFAIWTKFPHARFFVHYAAGCTMVESFYQSVRCPLQILPVGEPLAAPWAPSASVRVEEAGARGGAIRLQARVEAPRGAHYGDVLWLVDGRRAGTGPALVLDEGALVAGAHRVRAVARRTGLVRCQVFAEKEIRAGREPAAGSREDG